MFRPGRGCSSYSVALRVTVWLLLVPYSAVIFALTRRPISNSTRLMVDLFSNYNRDVRPVYNDSDPIMVELQLWFKQVLKVDEIDQILTIYCWTESYWTDEYLKWDPADYGGITVVHPPAEKLWRPDILVFNNADMNINDNELSTNIVLKNTGSVIYFRAVITKITCNLDMTYFPFDKQKCHMQFSSWSYDGAKLQLKERPTVNYAKMYIENLEWELMDFNVSLNKKFYDCCTDPYPDLTYIFILERNPSYYILNLIIPSVFITIVTMVGFFTPFSSTGENTEKVSLGVTALLSLAIILLMVSDKMPATSKVVPLIGNAGRPLAAQTKRLFFDYVAFFLLMDVDLAPKRPPPLAYSDDECDDDAAQEGIDGENIGKRYSTTTIDTTIPGGDPNSSTALLHRRGRTPVDDVGSAPYTRANGRVCSSYTRSVAHPSEGIEMSDQLFQSAFASAGVAAIDDEDHDNDDMTASTHRSSSAQRRHRRSTTPSQRHLFLFPSSIAPQPPPPPPPPPSRSPPLCAGCSRQPATSQPLRTTPTANDRPRTERRPNNDSGECTDDRANDALLLRRVMAPLRSIRRTLTSVNDRLEFEQRCKEIKREWEQLARVCERFLMVAFIGITVLFAVIMLQAPDVAMSAAEPIVNNQET